MRKILLTTVPILIYFTGLAQWTNNVAQNTTVRDVSGNEEITPLMVTISDGSTYVTWFQQNAITNYELRMQRLDKDGFSLWGIAGVLVSNYPQSTSVSPYDLKADQNGDAIVAFSDTRSGQIDIVAYKLSKNGTQMWGSSGIALTDQSATAGYAPTIGVLGNNDAIIAWNPSNSTSKWVDFQRISSSGTVVWPIFMQVKDIANVKKYSKATTVPFGIDEFVMLYGEQTGSGLSPVKLLAQHYDANGISVWPNSTSVSTYTIPAFFNPVAVSDEHNGFFVCFNTSTPANPGIGLVYVQHVSSIGATWNPIGVDASQLPNSHHFTPAPIAFDSINEILYVLIKVTDLSQGQSGVYIQKLDTAGAVLWNANAMEAVPVQTTYNDPNAFSITPTGVIISYKIGYVPNPQSLSAVKVDNAGAVLWGTMPVQICSVNSGKDDLSNGVFNNNQVVIVWMDERSDRGIYAQNIHDDGTLGLAVGINDFSSSNELLNIYPNPSQELNIYIKSNVASVDVKISDLSGRMLLHKRIKQNSDDIPVIITNSFPNGVYLVHVQMEGKNYYKLWCRE